MSKSRIDQSPLGRMTRAKQLPAAPTSRLGLEMLAFFDRSVAKRQTKMAKIAECWGRLVPETLCDHCALESFTRGSLVVVVDSSSHLYELKQLLLAGIQQQLLLACKASGLSKITLRPGRWYDGEAPGDRKVRFDR